MVNYIYKLRSLLTGNISQHLSHGNSRADIIPPPEDGLPVVLLAFWRCRCVLFGIPFRLCLPLMSVPRSPPSVVISSLSLSSPAAAKVSSMTPCPSLPSSSPIASSLPLHSNLTVGAGSTVSPTLRLRPASSSSVRSIMSIIIVPRIVRSSSMPNMMPECKHYISSISINLLSASA
jgi:hypothetical protein